jgi:hypothetical protein
LAKKKNAAKKKGLKPDGPIVLSVNICDTIIRDQLTKKVSLIGLFSRILAPTLPCRQGMNVYVALTNGHGEPQIEARLVRCHDQETIISVSGPLEFSSPLEVIELHFVWQRVVFEEYGEYAVDVYCGDTNIHRGSRKLYVVKPEQPPKA